MSAASRLGALATDLAAGRLIPYLGPDLLALDGAASPVPATPRELAATLAAKAPVPGRIRNNVWAAAQYIESHRHRRTLTALMTQIFAPSPAPNRLLAWLAGLPELPLVIDTWYDDGLTRAFADRPGWALVQGATRVGEHRDIWVKYFTAEGGPALESAAPTWPTLVYKPHGGAWPSNNFLISDSDYVEVLTEIDIQSPIPPEVKRRREGRGFLFLGCRFFDQMLRTYARQIMKRSAGPHYAVLPPELTRNEQAFLASHGIITLTMTLEEAADALIG